MAIDWLASDTNVAALVLKEGTYPADHGSPRVVRSLGHLGDPVFREYEKRLVPAAGSRSFSGGFVRRSCPINPTWKAGHLRLGPRGRRP